MIVVDASVVTKWFLPEDNSDLARRLFSAGFTLIAPSLIRTEVAGAILRAWRNERISIEAARKAVDGRNQALADEVISCVAVEDLYETAIAIAFETRHALHDCFYLAAGRKMDAQVITAEPTMHKRGSIVGHQVVLLADFPVRAAKQ